MCVPDYIFEEQKPCARAPKTIGMTAGGLEDAEDSRERPHLPVETSSVQAKVEQGRKDTTRPRLP